MKLRNMMKLAIAGVFFAAPALAGDPVPGVDVALEQIPGGVVFKGSVDADGRAVFPNVPAGDYKMTFTKKPKAAPMPMMQGTARQLTPQEILRIQRGVAAARSGVAAVKKPGVPTPKPLAKASPPAQISLCSQAKATGRSAPCTAISGFSQIGEITEIVIDTAKLEAGAVCGEISVVTAGTIALAPVSAAPPKPQAAESLNSSRSNTSTVTEPAEPDGPPPSAEDVNSTRSNTSSVAAPAGPEDTPPSAEDVNTVRSNNGNVKDAESNKGKKD